MNYMFFSAQFNFKKNPIFQLEKQAVHYLNNSLMYDFEVSGINGKFYDISGYFNVNDCVFYDVNSLVFGIATLYFETDLCVNDNQEIDLFRRICLFLNLNNQQIFYIDKHNKRKYIEFNYLCI